MTQKQVYNVFLEDWTTGDLRLLAFCLLVLMALALWVLVDELGGPREVISCCAAWLAPSPEAIVQADQIRAEADVRRALSDYDPRGFSQPASKGLSRETLNKCVVTPFPDRRVS